LSRAGHLINDLRARLRKLAMVALLRRVAEP
jgi:hypothetical protein